MTFPAIDSLEWRAVAIIPITILFVGGLLLFSQEAPVPERQQTLTDTQEIPDFSSYTNVKEKKTAFFEFMLEKIRKANALIAAERAQVQQMLATIAEGKSLSDAETEVLGELFKKYGLGIPDEFTPEGIRNLLVRVDTVPASLVLAQAANESAWGTSRFARDANNFFGIWCFTPGCGLTPSRRDSGKNHEVRKYPSVQAGVNHYVQLINTRRAYRELRMIRAELRDGNNVNGLALAEGLLRYSERGPAYVEEIQQMIRYNDLHEYTRDHSA